MSKAAINLTPKAKQAISEAAIFLAPIFEVEGWTYGWDKPHVPQRQELADTIEHLVSNVMDRRGVTSSGRITVVRRPFYEGMDTIEIMLDIGDFRVPAAPEDDGSHPQPPNTDT